MFGSTGATVSVAVIRVVAVVLFYADCSCPAFGGADRAWASGFFQLSPVEYFSDGKRSMRQQFQKTQKAMDWHEPVLTPDGRVTFYVPPQPVLRLLQDPSPEHARQYLAWQDEKMERVLKAQEAVAAVEEKEKRH